MKLYFQISQVNWFFHTPIANKGYVLQLFNTDIYNEMNNGYETVMTMSRDEAAEVMRSQRDTKVKRIE